MLRKIGELSTLQAMAEVEIHVQQYQDETVDEAIARAAKCMEEWIQGELHPWNAGVDAYSWRAVSAQWKARRDNFMKDDDSWVGVIYGVGGWHRWMVNAAGEVHFSASHCNYDQEKLRLVAALGFKVW